MAYSTSWDVRRLPDAEERTMLVTGGNAGIGYFISEQLAKTGARVVIASRNAATADLAIEAIRRQVPRARLSHVQLDLSRLDSVRGFVDRLGSVARLDALVLNAGLLAQSEYSITDDGNELVMGTNHLGNFALAESLLPLLGASPEGCIVTMSSVAARFTRLNLTDLQSTAEPYRALRTYARSKLAQTLFALELHRRLRAAGSGIRSVIAHPGGALDGLTPSRPPMRTRQRPEHLKALPKLLMAQSKEKAAWPAVRAALDPGISSGELWGPRILHSIGRPKQERIPAAWQNRDIAVDLWERSVQLTGTTWKSIGPVGDGATRVELS